MKHLTDEEIQNYLDRNIPEKMDEMKKHFDYCASCRENLSIYENIYAELEDETEFQLTPGFAAEAARKIAKKPLIVPKINFFNILIITASVLVMVIFAAQYIDFEAIGQTTVHSMIPSLNLQPDQMMNIEAQSVDTIVKFKFLFFGIGILGLFYLIDKVMLSKKMVKSKLVIISM